MGRFEQAAAKLRAYDLDALLVLSEPNRLYVTGFQASDGAALITQRGSWFFTDSRYIEAARRSVTGAEVAENTAEQSIVRLVNQALERTGARRVGFEEDRVTVADFRRLEESVHGELTPAGGLLAELRAVKDRGELETMIAAQRIAEAAFAEVLNFIRPGRTEQEIAAFLQYQMLLRGAERMSFDPIVVSGPNSSMPHGVPTAKPVADGEFITMDFGCVYRGYCSDMTRTVAVGHVTEEMEHVYQTVLRAQAAGIAAARAGVPGREIDDAGRQVIAEAGYGPYFGHSFGHGVGVEIHVSPNAAPRSEKPLPEGAVISAEPGIYLPGRFGVRIEDVIVLTGAGSENLMRSPKELLIL